MTSTHDGVERRALRDPGIVTSQHQSRAIPARVGELVAPYSGLVLLVLVFGTYSAVLGDRFLASDNLIGVLGNQATTTIIALGLLMPLAVGLFDLSIASNVTLSMVVAATLFSPGLDFPVWAVLLLTVGCGAAVGAVNAVAIVGLGINPFVVTLATGSILLGASQMISKSATLTEGIPEAFISLGRGTIAGVPLPVVYAILIAAVIWYALSYTPFGRHLYAIGANSDAARLSGVPTQQRRAIALVVCGAAAAFAGMMLTARLGSAPPNLGAAYLLPPYAAAFLGSTMIRPGRFNVFGLFVAIALLAIGINGLQLLGAPYWVEPVFQGAALLLAVFFARSTTDTY